MGRTGSTALRAALIGLALLGLVLLSRYSYPLFHTVVEIFTVVIALTAFVVVWHARRLLERDYLLLLGIALLFFALFDVMHLAAYKGIQLFPGFDADLPTQLHIAQRYMLAVSLVIAPVFARRRLNETVALGVYSAVTVAVLLSLFVWPVFPDAFVEGAGLTPFKVVSEYVISAVFLVAIASLLSIRRLVSPRSLRLTIAAVVALIVSELSFTRYSTPFGLPNLVGHLAQVAGFGLVYAAVVRAGFVEPYSLLYRELADSEQRFRATFEQAAVGVAQVAPDGRFLRVNDRYASMLGRTCEELQALTFQELTHPGDLDEDLAQMNAVIEGRLDTYSMEKRYIGKHGSIVWVLLTTSAVRLADGTIDYFVTVVEEITRRKLAEAERERVLGQLEASRRLSDGLNEVNELIHSALDLDHVLGQAVLGARHSIDADAAVVFLREGRTWHARYEDGVPEMAGIRLTEDESGLMRLATQGEMAVVDDLRADERMNPVIIERYRLRSALMIPLIARTEVIGALVVFHRSEVHSYEAVEVDFARKFAASLALAAENARLYEAEHAVAETLQEALISMPSEVLGLRFAHVYHSASEAARVGGDFYDAFELDGGLVGVVIGDISGKGIEAAALTSLVKTAVRAHAAEQPMAPSVVMRKTNALLVRESPPEVFATVLFGLFDRSDGRFVYCNAGHLPGLLVRVDGAIEALDATSPLIGAFSAFEYRDAEVRLAPGDTLYLYTDGIIEARGDAGMFGEERLVGAVGGLDANDLERQLRAILDRVRSFTGGPLTDDVAILALRWEAAAEQDLALGA